MTVVPRGVRLTFTHDASGLRLHSRTLVGKRPPWDEGAMSGASTGALVAEVRTAAGEVTYRRTVPHALPATTEIFGDVLQRVPVTSGAGAFTVIVPIEQPGAEVVLLGDPGRVASGRRAIASGPVELGRFPLYPEPAG